MCSYPRFRSHHLPKLFSSIRPNTHRIIDYLNAIYILLFHTLNIIGNNYANTQNAQWIGAKKVRNQWTWTDETPGPEPTSDLIYTNWMSGQPSGDGVCVHMWTDSGIWNDYLCSNPVALLPFTCEMPVIKRCE